MFFSFEKTLFFPGIENNCQACITGEYYLAYKNKLKTKKIQIGNIDGILAINRKFRL
jgi:hypothetical protein